MADPTNEDKIRIINELIGTLDNILDSFIGDVANMRGSGVSQAVINTRITEDLAAGNGWISPLTGKTKAVTEQLQQRYYSSGQEEVLQKETDEGGLLMWSAVGSNTCPDCTARHGRIRTLDQWKAIGMPGVGTTVCRHNCRCTLLPVENARRVYGLRPEASNQALQTKARSFVDARLKEIKKEQIRRGKEFASSTFAAKLGDFREEGASPTLSGFTSPASIAKRAKDPFRKKK